MKIEQVERAVQQYPNIPALAVGIKGEAGSDREAFKRMVRTALTINPRDYSIIRIAQEMTKLHLRAADKVWGLQALPSNPEDVFVTAIAYAEQDRRVVTADEVNFGRCLQIHQLIEALTGPFRAVTRTLVQAPGTRDTCYSWIEGADGFIPISDLSNVVVVPANYGGGLLARGVADKTARQLFHLASRKVAESQYALANWQMVAEFDSEIRYLSPRFRANLLTVTLENGMEAVDCADLAKKGEIKRFGATDTVNAGLVCLGAIDETKALFGQTNRHESGQYPVFIAPIDARGLAKANLLQAVA